VLSRELHEDLDDIPAGIMATDAAQEIYATRRHSGGRPFAVIKHTFVARSFQLRGLKNMRQKWRWLARSFDLDRLMSLMRSRAGPERPATCVTSIRLNLQQRDAPVPTTALIARGGARDFTENSQISNDFNMPVRHRYANITNDGVGGPAPGWRLRSW
jgi:hypothetical protein